LNGQRKQRSLELGSWPTPSRTPSGTAAPSEHHDFQEIYERHFAFAWRSLRLLGVRKEALDDAVQDVFSAVARQLPGFEGRSSLQTWIFAIVQKTAANHRRTRVRKLDRLEPLDEGLATRDPTPQAHAEGREAAQLIQSFCAQLEESRRAVFMLGLLEGVPAGEIAGLLGIPTNTVYTRVHALRKDLEAWLARHEVER
jgi:RNA polymerase sigma-70 factor (ECF subfamily)